MPDYGQVILFVALGFFMTGAITVYPIRTRGGQFVFWCFVASAFGLVTGILFSQYMNGQGIFR